MSGSRLGHGRPGGRVRREARRPGVEALEARRLLATFTVTNNQDLLLGVVVPGSLRDEIDKANANPGPDKIVFNIAGSGIHTIEPSIALPTITDAVSIDGTTQPGYAGQPLIEIDGAIAGVGVPGLRLASGSILVKALAINRFTGAGIRVEANQDTIQLCFLGTNPTGNSAEGNGDAGLYLAGASNTMIGGYDATSGSSLGNVIAGNGAGGINIFGNGATSNQVLGNFIGTDVSGGRGVGNTGDGLIINGGSFNLIGGTDLGSANVISGNSGNGVHILGGAHNNSVMDNYIGTDGSPSGAGTGSTSGGNIPVANGAAGVAINDSPRNFIGGSGDPNGGNIISGNTGAGVLINNSNSVLVQGNIIGADYSGTKNLGNLGTGVDVVMSSGVQIGGTLSGASNIIAFNGKPGSSGGATIESGTNNPILNNSFFSNYGLGIILSSPGGQPVLNGSQGTTGPNNYQPFPVLTEAATAAGRTLIQGTITAQANTVYTIQFYSNASRDPSNFGEGQSLIGTKLITTDGTGLGTINVTLPTPTVVGQYVSATATDPMGNTSEFSLDQQVTQANQANLAVAIVATPNPSTLGSPLSYTLTISNNGPDPATGVQLVDTLPLGVTFDSATATQGTVSPAANLVIGDIGTIAPLATVTVTIVVTPNATGQVVNTANVTSGEIDPDTSDNTATQTTTVDIPADLGVTLKSDPTSVTVGQNVSLVAIVTNFGPGAATGAKMTITLPPGVSYVTSASGQGSTTYANGVVTANIGTLANGVSSAVRVTVTAPISVPASGALSVSASVSANEIEPAGPDPTPNTVTLAVPVLPSSDLSVTLTPNPEPILAGQNLTYSYVVQNNGPSAATNVLFSNVVPAGVQFLAVPPPSQGSALYDGTTVSANLGTIAPGGSVTGTFVVRPLNPGSSPTRPGSPPISPTRSSPTTPPPSFRR